MMDNITWTREKREQLRKAYAEARQAGKDVFEFDGHEYVTRYAGYLLKYLDARLGA